MDVLKLHESQALTRRTARLAAMREYDEPFIFDGETPKDLKPFHDESAARGLTVVSGGRFYHLLGNNHKGNAMMRIASLYNRQYPSTGGHSGHIPTIALGDSPNDLFNVIACGFSDSYPFETGFSGT